MSNISEKIWAIIEYAPPIGTLLFASWIALEIDRRQVASDQKLTWILLILVLIASTQLIERLRSLRLIREGIRQLPDLLRRETKLFRRTSKEVDFRELAQSASSIDILAWSAVAFYNSYDGFIRTKIVGGCKVRLLIIDKSSKAAEVIMENSEDKDLIGDIDRMKARAARDCQKLANATGILELRTMEWLVPFGMVIIDGDRPKGSLSIGVHPVFLPTPRDMRRFLLIDATTSTSDFTYFRDQFEALWEIGTPVCSSRAHEEVAPA